MSKEVSSFLKGNSFGVTSFTLVVGEDDLVDGDDADGYGWTTEDKAAGGRWTLVLKQTYPFVFSKADDWAQARHFGEPSADNYSCLVFHGSSQLLMQLRDWRVLSLFAWRK